MAIALNAQELLGVRDLILVLNENDDHPGGIYPSEVEVTNALGIVTGLIKWEDEQYVFFPADE